MPSLLSPTLLVGALTVLVSVLSAAEVRAQQEEAPIRVALASDLRVFVGDEVATTPSDAVELQRALMQGADSQWRAAPVEVSVLGVEAIEEAVSSAPMFEGNLELAREWGRMGVESYKRVQTRAASEYLERSLQYFQAIHYDIVAPREVSEILMYLALSYLEDGTNVVRPLDVLQEMVRRDPARQLRRGYYPDFVVQYFENARETLWRQLRTDGPPEEESRRIAQLVDADYIFHAYAIPTDQDRVELVAYLYDVAQERLVEREQIVVVTPDAATVQEGFGRLASRLSACLIEPPEVEFDPAGPGRSGLSRLSLLLGMTYGSFFRLPTPIEDPFGNYGLAVGLNWAITDEFRLFSVMQLTNSMRDFSGLLREDFTTLRGVAGGQLGVDLGPLHLGVGVGLEITRFGPVAVFTDKSCLPDPDRLCPGDSGKDLFDDHRLHWGVQIRPTLSWSLTNTFALSSTVAVGYYFSPLQNQLLNLPVSTEIVVEYRF